jgi:SET domain-containing protein
MKYGSYYNVSLKESPGQGRGVFAEEPISADSLILVEPVLMLSDDETLQLEVLSHYLFQMGDSMAIGLGVSTFMNHSGNPNVRVNRLIDRELLEYYALRDIMVGEELTHRYVRELWFSPVEEESSVVR